MTDRDKLIRRMVAVADSYDGEVGDLLREAAAELRAQALPESPDEEFTNCVYSQLGSGNDPHDMAVTIWNSARRFGTPQPDPRVERVLAAARAWKATWSRSVTGSLSWTGDTGLFNALTDAIDALPDPNRRLAAPRTDGGG